MVKRTPTGTDSDTRVCIPNLLQLESIKNEIDSLSARKNHSFFKSSQFAIKKKILHKRLLTIVCTYGIMYLHSIMAGHRSIR